jgi:putative flippase GtrA
MEPRGATAPHEALPVRSLLRRLGSILRYGSVGALSFATFSVISAAPALLPALPPPVATAAAILAAGVVNFLGHRWFTFRSQRSVGSSALRYLILLGVNAAAGGGIVALGLMAGLPLVAANAICLGVITIVTYIAMDRIVM